jgi:hypothetical protein
MDLLQWPAMVASVTAAWLVGSRREGRRHAGFWVFLVGNALWFAWGWHDGAWALVAMQLALAVMNVRGVRRTDDEPSG